LLETLAVELPILQAGMGGGIDGHELAAAVSEAGGLGTIGALDPPRLRQELRRARELTGKPLAVNLLLPFARAEHWKVAAEADAVITFWGRPDHRPPGIWIHQCGDVAEARAARAAGADALIVQGVEAGGHVRGEQPGLELLERVKATVPDCPLILAGGIATVDDVRRALAAGAGAVLAGTRFLLAEESCAPPEYKRRLLAADRTVLTDLFGFGWPGRHRVVPNAATERWLGADQRAPDLVRATHRLTAPVVGRLPLAAAARLSSVQTVRLPLFGPSAPLVDSPARMVDVAPLYAGETVARIDEIRPAAELVRELAAGAG
jgi:NAD(P)H-dependent flavin oxidoreductase YrpB (nitropropane dioxygenase family)